MAQNIIVTGGAGFVGSHLCEKLSQDKNLKVYSIDNYSTGSEDNHVSGVEYIKDTTLNMERYSKIKPAAVYHLGEYSRVEKSLDEPFNVLSSNLVGTLKVIEYCFLNNAKFIYAGSSTKFDFDNDGVNKSPYSFSKNVNSKLISNINNWTGLNYCIAYFYNVYGPREITSGDYATVIGIFKEKFLNNEKLPVVLPGSQRRIFTHVSDIVDGLLLLEQFGFGDGYGIGSKDEYEIIAVANMFGGKIEYIGEQRANRSASMLCDEKMRKLGWIPNKDLKDYISDIRSGNI